MLTLADFARIALRHDTLMARAMLRACGVPAPDPPPVRGAIVRADRYEGVAECFRNLGSPMDGRP